MIGCRATSADWTREGRQWRLDHRYRLFDHVLNLPRELPQGVPVMPSDEEVMNHLALYSIEQFVARFTIPIMYAFSRGDGILGTGTLFQTGDRFFVITASIYSTLTTFARSLENGLIRKSSHVLIVAHLYRSTQLPLANSTFVERSKHILTMTLHS